MTIDEVGNVAAFLLSDLASAITGEITYVDCGYSTVAVGRRGLTRRCAVARPHAMPCAVAHASTPSSSAAVTTASSARPTSPRRGMDVCVLERRGVVGGAAVTEEFHPGFRNSTASYTVSLLHPKVIRDLDLAAHGLAVVERPFSNFLPLLRRATATA